MARTRRFELLHPTLHIYSRGADRQDIFSADRDHALFEELLAELPQRFGIEVHAVAQMNNHVHLIVDRSEGDVSAAMQFLFSRYALAYNQRTERTGPLFSGRFGATEITSDEQLLQCSRYLHLNPLDIVPRSAITAYRWSSLGVYAGRRDVPDWLQTERIPRLFHRTDDEYLRFVLTPQPGDRQGRPTTPWRTLTLHDVTDAVAAEGGGYPLAVRRGRTDLARRLAIGLALELRVADVGTLAEHHGISPAGVRNAARRLRVARSDDPSLKTRFDRIARRLKRTEAAAGYVHALDDAS